MDDRARPISERVLPHVGSNPTARTMNKRWADHYEAEILRLKKENKELKDKLDRYRNPFKSDATTNLVKLSKCEGCGKMIDISGGAGTGGHEGCQWVYGRRGWRQLGAYDG